MMVRMVDDVDQFSPKDSASEYFENTAVENEFVFI